ncbi:MAG: response regulator [SAR324 cluster bacterium]|uniref:histidine kinase n=1 Tax=SAR324 cluster bacterium TaxID=2024889 RepID=A0A7X9FUE1_9DELT|nr:response regulator [SAR324 cluster bacterium]
MEEIHVLVVDDEEHMRNAIDRVISRFSFHASEVDSDVSFTTEQVGSGEDALMCFERKVPDLLFLDQKLPGISGLDVLEKVSGKAPGMLTIMITAYASIETAVKATKQGAYDFLPKPFTPAELKYVTQKAAGRILLARSAKRLAEEKKQIRFEFIRVLGHELKAPIGAVGNYLALMKKKTLGETLEAYEDVIDRSQIRLDQMQKLVADLLDMTRIESGQRIREIAVHDLREIAEKSIELVDLQAKSREITLSLNEGSKVLMNCDRSEMEMIFNNLLSNAVKYNKDGGRVEVQIEQLGDQIQIKVSDTGIGMSHEETKRLFNEFVRIKNEKTFGILGSGLGLSIVKRLAELNGGSVRVESEADVGSTFIVTLHNKSLQ